MKITSTANKRPLAGTPAGDQLRQEFVYDLLSLLGDTRILWLPAVGDTTSTTEESRNARVFTYDATIASRINTLGSGIDVTFDGTDDEADSPDQADFSFGDGAVDQPFSIVALLNSDGIASGQETVFCKHDETSGSELREWQIVLDGDENCFFYLWDESANARIGRRSSTGASGWTNYTLTYDGSSSDVGISIYRNGAGQAEASDSSGTYVAMENSATVVQIGKQIGASANDEFFDGRLALIALCAKQLSHDEAWAIKELINGFFNLTL